MYEKLRKELPNTVAIMRKVRELCGQRLEFSREDQLRVFADSANVMAAETLNACFHEVKSDEHMFWLIQDFRARCCYAPRSEHDRIWRFAPMYCLYEYLISEMKDFVQQKVELYLSTLPQIRLEANKEVKGDNNEN